MATTHPRSRPIYSSPPLRYAAQREDLEYCTHLLTYPPLVRLVARDGFVDRRPRALELGVQNADLQIARQLHIRWQRCTVSGVC